MKLAQQAEPVFLFPTSLMVALPAYTIKQRNKIPSLRKNLNKTINLTISLTEFNDNVLFKKLTWLDGLLLEYGE